ncbi:hypothetical protein NC796_11785 [Aliifodinibius sp. S!AR15-10]|uniref:hypothetical protein n=1 Tax=Aliifodinibius sp. S!AR15-10 TaxID=2950437 RepID=UPI00285E6DF6|nr:hypothetical protein [Aliifodinibius sp. S!AR15-10]MDR8391829.1 hypothetical protein [Aliifodinibius sp. S!AR15-10]
MILLISILTALFILSGWFGYRQYLRLEHLNQRNVSNTLLIAMIILTLLSAAHWIGIFTQAVAAQITMGLYTMATGFFLGIGIKLIVKKTRAGAIGYMHRSFWIDIAPNLIAVLLVAYGIYRTGILTFGPFSGIGITSGLSLIGFGFFGWTVRIVPEFRARGILILDQFIEWKLVLALEWYSEDVITIDYMTEEGKICEFNTSIPPEDRKLVEQLLSRRIKEHERERKKVLDKAG